MPQPKVLRKVTITGNATPVYIGETRTFIIPTPNKQTYYNWNTNNPNMQITDGQGSATVTIKYIGGINGTCDISCTAVSNCYTYQISGLTLSKFNDQPINNLLTKSDLKP